MDAWSFDTKADGGFRLLDLVAKLSTENWCFISKYVFFKKNVLFTIKSGLYRNKVMANEWSRRFWFNTWSCTMHVTNTLIRGFEERVF